MESILTILATGFVCMVGFVMGAKLAQKVKKGEDIKTPTINPMKAYREHEAKKEEQMERNRMDTILRNIEAYDGTGKGQEDVPGR